MAAVGPACYSITRGQSYLGRNHELTRDWPCKGIGYRVSLPGIGYRGKLANGVWRYYIYRSLYVSLQRDRAKLGAVYTQTQDCLNSAFKDLDLIKHSKEGRLSMFVTAPRTARKNGVWYQSTRPKNQDSLEKVQLQSNLYSPSHAH